METLKRKARRISFGSMNTFGAPRNESFPDSDGWTVVLKRLDTRKQMTVPFYMGRGHSGSEPGALDVLECLILDAVAFENCRSFEEWCSEFGYDEDSRKAEAEAEAVYRAVEKQTAKLRRFLGDDYDSFLFETDY